MPTIRLLLLIACICAPKALAVSFALLPAVGLLQPPSTSYFYASYGASFDMIGSETAAGTNTWMTRIDFAQRPKFTSYEYSDQDSLSAALVGKRFHLTESISCSGLFGYGRAWGYIERVGGERRSYIMSGPDGAIEVASAIAGFEFALGNQTLFAFADNSQTQGGVAWPFNYTYSRFGYRF